MWALALFLNLILTGVCALCISYYLNATLSPLWKINVSCIVCFKFEVVLNYITMYIFMSLCCLKLQFIPYEMREKVSINCYYYRGSNHFCYISVLWMQRENIIANNLLYLLYLCKKFLYFNKILIRTIYAKR